MLPSPGSPLVAALDSQILWVVLAALALTLLVYKSKPLRSWFPSRVVGPIFWYDLARLARRNRTILLRSVYGLLLLVWLYVVFNERFPGYLHLGRLFEPGPRLSPREMARFALSMVAAVVAVQGAAVFIITPAYLANAIAEERERRTLELLFTAPLLDREIVLGKLFGRLAHMGMILLTGLPILALVRLWGGVDGGVLLAGFAITGLTMLSVGSISMLCSVLAPNVLTAVVSSYGAVALFGLFTLGCPSASPLNFLSEFNRSFLAALDDWRGAAISMSAAGLPPAAPDSSILLLQMLIPATILHGLVFLICAAVSIGAVRGAGPDVERAGFQVSRPVIPEDSSWGPFEEPEIPIRRSPHYVYYVAYPPRAPVCDPPLLWKEVYHGGLAWAGPLWPKWSTRKWVQLTVPVALVALFFACLNGLFPETMREATNALNLMIRGLTIVFAGIWCIALAFRAAISVCRERDQKTLEGLFLLPVERKEILWAKWFGSILRTRQLGYCLLVTWTVGLATCTLHAWAVLLLASACCVYAAFLTSLGIWLSLMNRNMLWANLSMALVLMLLVTGSVLGETNYRSVPLLYKDPGSLRHWMLDVGFNPVRTWWMSGFTWTEFADRLRSEDPLLGPTYGSILAGLGVLGVVAWLLWRMACIRFGKELERRRR